jgi:hypothetical protein
MALIESDPINSWQELGEVGQRLETFRAAIDEARRNGWREADRLGDEMEQYLSAVRVDLRSSTDDGPTARNAWSR